MESLQESVCGLLAPDSRHLLGTVEARILLKYAGVSPLTNKQRYLSGQRGWDRSQCVVLRRFESCPLPKIQPRRIL